MKSTLQEAIGLDGDAWLRIDSRSGKIELNIDEQWQETGWRFNAITDELEVLLGSVYERSGYGYSEKTGVVTSLQDAPVSRPPSWDFQPLRQWLSSNHNWALLCGLLLVASSFLGFHNHTSNSFPAVPIAMCILAALFATWLVWRRSSMKAALLFILAMTSSRAMWLYPLLHRDTPGSSGNSSLQIHSNATASPESSGFSKKLFQYVKNQDEVGVKEIVSSGADPNFPNPDGSGESLLHLAAATGNVEIVTELLKNGAVVNALNNSGEIPLHAAVESRSAEIVRILLNHGAATDVRAKNGGQCALDRNIRNNGKPGGNQIHQLLLDAMVARGEMVLVPDDKPPASGAAVAEETSAESLADQIKVVSDNNDMCSWTLRGKTIYSSPYLRTSDSTHGEPSPDGRYIHFGSMKENANKRSALVFRREQDSLACLGDITPRVIQAVNESGILPAGRILDDECFADVVRWSGPGKLLLTATCRQRGEDGFTISNFSCLWDIGGDTLSYAPSESAGKVDVKFFGDQGPNSPDSSSLISGEAERFKGEMHPETRTRILNETDVSGWTKDINQYAINEMFARHGFYFGSEKTRSMFSQFPWYKPDPTLTMDAIESRFSSIEAANLKLLGAVRNRGTATAADLSNSTGRPDSQAYLEDFNSQVQGLCTGITYYKTPTGQGAVFNSRAESRIEYSFARGFPTQGTLELKIYVTGAYGYSQGVADPNRKDALIFTTVGPDTWHQGSSWLTVSSNGNVTFGLVEMVKNEPKCRNLVAKGTKFKFGEWHDIGISYGAKGRMINVDGVVVAKDDLSVPLGAGGTPKEVIDAPTLGEMRSTCWPNNFHDSGFNGVIDTFRASHAQADWRVCTRP